MAGSVFGNHFKIMTFGESHGKGLGVTIDGCPAGLELCEEDIQKYLDRRKPGQSSYTTARNEADAVEILSGVFEGRTTGTPIALLIRNKDQHSKDYSNICDVFRPGHADYGFFAKYGFRDYRGGGRSSGRETVARVAAGAVAMKILASMGVNVHAYAKSIGPVSVSKVDLAEAKNNSLCMPDPEAARLAEEFLQSCMKRKDSVGGVIECVASGMPAGVGDPVFGKLDAMLAQAIMSIGAVKGFEIGDGFLVAESTGSVNNDAFYAAEDGVATVTNHAGGILGGISNGEDIILRAAFKPTPSIGSEQKTVNEKGEECSITIHGRHDPIVVPRAVVVVEAMTAITLVDALLSNMGARLDSIIKFYGREL
ncbi:chorismate synthase [Lachnospiraceae bacterium C10]|nr:chorismate synthase [Lachnospiraceae bacterium C10]